jgi:hypothetical protein
MEAPVDEIDTDQAEIMSLLAPYLTRMYPLFPKAVDFYNASIAPQARAQHSDRARANAIWCHLWHGFQEEFGTDAGFHFLNVGNLNVLNIGDKLLLRPKKVDANGRHRNASTLQQRQFDAQTDLPGLPPQAARIIMGYQPDAAFSCVERVTVRRPHGAWVSQIVDTGTDCVWEDITPRELPFREARRKAGG